MSDRVVLVALGRAKLERMRDRGAVDGCSCVGCEVHRTLTAALATDPDELVERAARAISRSEGAGFDADPEWSQEVYRRQTRAVLSALAATTEEGAE